MRLISNEGVCHCQNCRSHWLTEPRRARAEKQLSAAAPTDITLVPISPETSEIYLGPDRIGRVENHGFAPETPPVYSYAVTIYSNDLGPFIIETSEHGHIAILQFLAQWYGARIPPHPERLHDPFIGDRPPTALGSPSEPCTTASNPLTA